MTSVQRHEATWNNPTTGHLLFYRLWEPVHSNAFLVVIHGFGEHSGRYESFAQALAEHGIGVLCPDLWGHGRSLGRRGDFDGVDQYLNDLQALISTLLVPLTDRRDVVIFGHSFGGLLAIHWVLRHPEAIRCAVLQSPLLRVGFPVPQWKARLVECLERMWPTLALPIGLNPAWLSHDVAVVQRYREDSLVHHQISLRGYRVLQDTMSQAITEAAQMTKPTLLLYGTDDLVISVETCQEVFEALTCEKRLRVFAGCYHELHHEPVKVTVVEEIAQWVKKYA